MSSETFTAAGTIPFPPPDTGLHVQPICRGPNWCTDLRVGLGAGHSVGSTVGSAGLTTSRVASPARQPGAHRVQLYGHVDVRRF